MEIVKFFLQTGWVAKVVLVILIIFSLASWSVILGKWRELNASWRTSERFLKIFREASRLNEVAAKGGMALDLARAATPETLRLLIAPTGEIEPGRCWLLAETLYLDGIQARLLEDVDRASDSLEKSRMLFSLLQPMGAFLVGFPEAAERVQEIDEILACGLHV